MGKRDETGQFLEMERRVQRAPPLAPVPVREQLPDCSLAALASQGRIIGAWRPPNDPRGSPNLPVSMGISQERRAPMIVLFREFRS